jgi:hypothetical protein
LASDFKTKILNFLFKGPGRPRPLLQVGPGVHCGGAGAPGSAGPNPTCFCGSWSHGTHQKQLEPAVEQAHLPGLLFREQTTAPVQHVGDALLMLFIHCIQKYIKIK